MKVFGRAGDGLVGLFAVLLVSACTSGQPDAETTMPSPSSANAEPTRPTELSLEGKQDMDLCRLLTPEQQDQLSLRDPGPSIKDEDMPYPGCSWLATSEPPYSVSLRAIPMGLDELMGRVRQRTPETAESYAIAGGFRTEQSQIAGLESFGCIAHVDVADRWTLDVGLGTPPDDMSNQQMCDTAKQAAEFAVTTLKSQG